jgi:hypothetical protein
MFNLGMLGHLDTFFVDKYQGTDLGLNKTNKATTVSVDTIESMSIATITTNTPQGIIYLPNIDVLYTNETTKQFAFITKSTTYKNKIKLITNDKQLMMRTIKRVINKRVLRIEELKKTIIRRNSTLNSTLIDTYHIMYDNTIGKLYQIYNTINEKIKSL